MPVNPFGMTLALLGLGFILVPAVVLLPVAVQWYRTRAWTRCEAHVQEVEVRATHGGHDQGTLVLAHYRYQGADGQDHEGSGSLDRKRIDLDAPDGRDIDILVHPSDPARSVVRTSVGRRLAVLAVLLVPVAVAGALTLAFGLGEL